MNYDHNMKQKNGKIEVEMVGRAHDRLMSQELVIAMLDENKKTKMYQSCRCRFQGCRLNTL